MGNIAIGQFLDFINSNKPTKKPIIEKAKFLKKSAETNQIRDAFKEGMRYVKRGLVFIEYPPIGHCGETYNEQ